MKIMHVVGARPNFMKMAPIIKAMSKYPENFQQILVHTGQHYSAEMSQIFFEELELPKPDVNLEVGSGSHAWQTAQIMTRFEPVLLDYKPDWLLVPGDVNSTLACSLVAGKLGVNIAHIEAGLRSFDSTMPEEMNRIIVDHVANLLFTTESSANENLTREGISSEKIKFVGNVMIDTLVQLLPKAEARWCKLQEELDLDRYILVTFHRPSNVDNPHVFAEIMKALSILSDEIPVLFPIHPRTRSCLGNFIHDIDPAKLKITNPLGYLDFLAVEMHASLVITDSGGLQEETTYLKVPCLTVRPNTERPVTITVGTNRLIANQGNAIVANAREALSSKSTGNRPELWDGHASQRIIDSLKA